MMLNIQLAPAAGVSVGVGAAGGVIEEDGKTCCASWTGNGATDGVDGEWLVNSMQHIP